MKVKEIRNRLSQNADDFDDILGEVLTHVAKNQLLLNKAFIAMEAFTNQEGDMPENTGEFNDLKTVMLEIEEHLKICNHVWEDDGQTMTGLRQWCPKCRTSRVIA